MHSVLNGKIQTTPSTWVFEFEGDRIKERRNYFDMNVVYAADRRDEMPTRREDLIAQTLRRLAGEYDGRS